MSATTRYALALLALLLPLATTTGCGGHAAHPREPVVSPITMSWITKAEEQEQMRQHNRARLLYLRAERESPDDASRAYAAAEYASILNLWDERDEARRQLLDATRLAPDVPRYWHDLGIVETRLGHAPAAEQALRRAVKLAPRDPRPHVALADLYRQIGRYDDAIAELETCLHLDIPHKVRRAIEQRALPDLRRAAAGQPGQLAPSGSPR